MSKLKFYIVFCSSEDPEHPVTELYVHNQKSIGWQTPKGYVLFCLIYFFTLNFATLAVI